MPTTLSARIEHWPLNAPFRISRGVKTEAVVLVVQVHGPLPSAEACIGWGEAVPYPRYGETPEGVLEQIGVLAARLGGVRVPTSAGEPGARVRTAGRGNESTGGGSDESTSRRCDERLGQAIQFDLPAGLTRTQIATLLPPGAARNAIDCALWDLEAQQAGSTVAQLIGGPQPGPLTTAVTVSLDTPEAMAVAARRIAGAPVIKLKVDARAPAAAIEAVAGAASGARLIVDPNESWSFELLQAMQPVLRAAGVVLVEQPLRAGADEVLGGFEPLVPVCADESVHTVADVERLGTRYQAVNIKLDKTGGLTEALRLRTAARERGLGVMVGCMVCTSLGIAPALHVAAGSDFIDLDGPWWLTRDRAGGARIEGGRLMPPDPGLWGCAARARP